VLRAILDLESLAIAPNKPRMTAIKRESKATSMVSVIPSKIIGK